MLERAAAGLESCRLQNILPKASLRATKRRQRLRAGFWQHGAAALDISQHWPADEPSDQNPRSERAAVRPLTSDLRASVFQFDFLYPSYDLPNLRKPWRERQRGSGPDAKERILRRRYSAPAIQEALPTDNEPLAADDLEQDAAAKPTASEDLDPFVAQFSSRIADELDEETGKKKKKKKKRTRLYQDDAEPEAERLRPIQEQEPEPEAFRHVYDAFQLLGDPERLALRSGMALYLSKSRSAANNDRATTLLSTIPTEQWTDGLLQAIVIMFLRNGDRTSAINEFKRVSNTLKLQGGLEHLLADCFVHKDWDAALAVWSAFHGANSASFVNVDVEGKKTHIFPFGLLNSLSSIPQLGSLYFSFERHLADRGEKTIELPPNPTRDQISLFSIRRKFAKLALRQPCSPAQAAIILKQWKLNHWYAMYFEDFLGRWYRRTESRSTLRQLPRLYEHWRQLPDFKLNHSGFQVMYHALWPTKVSALESLRRDWEAVKPLTAWGFEAFLRLYSRLGDIRATQQVWEEFIRRFPQKINAEAVARYANVFTRNGKDPHTVQRALEEQVAELGITPDIRARNVVLRAYARAHDYPGALKYFEDIVATDTPSSHTYGHIMTLCGRMGDLDKVVEIFSQAQAARIPISADMVRGLVDAYARNDRLDDAEHIAYKFADLGVTGPNVWNVFMREHTTQGSSSRCKRMMDVMKYYGIEPNEESYEYLMSAHARLGQATQAFEILLEGEKKTHFQPTAEHYGIIMTGAARSRDFNLVHHLARRMLNLKHSSRSFNARVAMLEAACRGAAPSKRVSAISSAVRQSMMALLETKVARQVGSGQDNVAPSMALDDITLKSRTRQAGRAVTLLIGLRDFASAEELCRTYATLFPDESANPDGSPAASMPAPMMTALMNVYYGDERYDKVLETWNSYIRKALPRITNGKTGQVYPGHAYALTPFVRVLARTFVTMGDRKGLFNWVIDWRDRGFSFTSSNWDVMLRALVELGDWEYAMDCCEQLLMKNWRGWNRTMQLGTTNNPNPRDLRPTRALVMALEKEYLKLRELAPWSPAVASKLERISATHPRLVGAFSASRFESLRWSESIRSEQEPVDRVLRDMSVPQLHKTRRLLQRYRGLQERSRLASLESDDFDQTREDESPPLLLSQKRPQLPEQQQIGHESFQSEPGRTEDVDKEIIQQVETLLAAGATLTKTQRRRVASGKALGPLEGAGLRHLTELESAVAKRLSENDEKAGGGS